MSKNGSSKLPLVDTARNVNASDKELLLALAEITSAIVDAIEPSGRCLDRSLLLKLRREARSVLRLRARLLSANR